VAPGLDPEMIEVRVGEEEDLDDVSLSLRLQMSLSGDAEVQVVPATSQSASRSNLRWRMKDIEEVDAVCNTSISDPPDEEITPFEYFKQMCTDEVIENFVEQSNLYCVQKTGRPLNTNKNEMEQFLGIHIMTGIVNMPSYKMYWADLTRSDPIADVMSRNRYDTMRNYFHINNKDSMKAHDDPEYAKLFKVRPFVGSIKSSFRETEVEEYNSVDELIIPFKGRSSLKQYVRNNPHKWGIKVFARAASSGIVYDFEVYMGKGTVKKNSPLGISGDIVLRLVDGLPKGQNSTEDPYTNWTIRIPGRKFTRRNYGRPKQEVFPIHVNRYNVLHTLIEPQTVDLPTTHKTMTTTKINSEKSSKKCSANCRKCRNKRKIIIIGDSRAKGCAANIKQVLGKTAVVTGCVSPGSKLDNITSMANNEIN
jgi:hypothetical protein